MQLQTLLLVIVDVFGRVLVVYQQAVLLMVRVAWWRDVPGAAAVVLSWCGRMEAASP